MEIFTIGYEGAVIDDFVARLRDAGIRVIIDVRELPLSHKRGFSKSALAGALSAEGIGYIHMSRLGCPKAVRNAYKASGDLSGFRRAFHKHLAGERDALDQALAEVLRGGVCLLCFEADYAKCHRSMVADALIKLKGGELEVVNLAGASSETGG